MSDLNKKENKKNFIGTIRESFSGRKFRSGAYVTMVSTIVIVMIVVVNMLVTKMNLKLDMSSQELYTLSEATTGLINNLKDEVTIYYMVEPGSETAVFKEIADKYDTQSSKIKLEVKDPVLYPKFASQYVKEEVKPGDFIFVNQTNNRAKYVSGEDLLVKEINYETYQEETKGIDVEGQFTSAIQYVTNEDLPTLYKVEGHGEAEVSQMFTDAMEKMNITVQSIKTVTQTAIPEDCDILYINAPETDFTEEETNAIKDYMAAGGNAVIILDYKSEEFKNFNSLLQYYGVISHGGIVVEGDANMHHADSPIFLIPSVGQHEATSQLMAKKIPVVLQYASGITISDTLRSSLKVEPLLQTSASSYDKLNTQSATIEKEVGDMEGPFYVGVAATESFNDVTSKLVVYSSELTFDDSTVGYGNADLLSGTIDFLSGEMKTLSIPTKSVTPDYIILTMQQAILWGAVVVILLPALILITGVVVSIRRRKK